MGARPAIQSQWTFRPISGLTVALITTRRPTTPTADTKDMGQLRDTESGPWFVPLRPALVFSLLVLPVFFIAHL